MDDLLMKINSISGSYWTYINYDRYTLALPTPCNDLNSKPKLVYSAVSEGCFKEFPTWMASS